MAAIILYWLSKLLVGLFFIGLVGSAIVVVITFIEDGKLLVERDDERPHPPGPAAEGAAAKAREAF